MRLVKSLKTMTKSKIFDVENVVGECVNGESCLAFDASFLHYIFPVTHNRVNADI